MQEQGMTMEQKTRAFAMYWGCAANEYKDGVAYPCKIDDETIDRFCNVEIDLKLLLKELSQISDEDAVEVAKLKGMPDNAEILKVERCYMDTPQWYLSIDYRYRHQNSEYNNKDGYSYSGTAVLLNPVQTPAAFQYLIEMGYSVPLRCLNGLDPISAGIAIPHPTK